MEIHTSYQPEFKSPRFSALQIAELRGRLGQSRADFARAMGVSLELIYGWEKGQEIPSAAQRSNMARLAQHADEYAEKVAMRPSLEMALRDRRVDQIHASEIILNGAATPIANS